MRPDDRKAGAVGSLTGKVALIGLRVARVTLIGQASSTPAPTSALPSRYGTVSRTRPSSRAVSAGRDQFSVRNISVREQCLGGNTAAWSMTDPPGKWIVDDYLNAMAATTEWETFSSADGVSAVQFPLEKVRLVANRGPSKFGPDTDELNINRGQNSHAAVAHAHPIWPGVPLTRVEAKIADGVTCTGHGVLRRIEARRLRFTVPDAVS